MFTELLLSNGSAWPEYLVSINSGDILTPLSILQLQKMTIVQLVVIFYAFYET
jgi:hypothetical protein